MRLLFLLVFALLGCTRMKDLRPDENGLYHEIVPRFSDANREVELYWMKPRGKGPWPAVLFLHGNIEAENSGGKILYDWGAMQKMQGLGYLAISVSLPGYGKSSGPRDFAGPDSQQAAQDVIRLFRKRRQVDPKKFVVVGVSRGASVAAKLGEQVSELAGVVLVSGFYDLGATYQKWKLETETPEAQSLASALEHETVMSDAGPLDLVFTERSALPFASIRCPVLVLQGAKDPLTILLQAEELVKKLNARNVEAKAIIYPEAGHRIPAEAREREIEPFLARVLSK